MTDKIAITHTGFCIVELAYYAFHDGGQFEISQQEAININWKLKSKGEFSVTRAEYEARNGAKYIY